MYCSGCGHQVGAEERVCTGCGRELWGSGALRLTSPREPARQLSDVFPSAGPALSSAESVLPPAGPALPSAESAPPSAEPVEATAPSPVRRIRPALQEAPALTSLPALRQITTRPRTERDSRALHRRNQLVMAACFAAVALALAMILVLAQMLRTSGPVRLAGSDRPRTAPASRVTSASTPKPSVKPVPSKAASRALRLPDDARSCSALVGASEGTSCGLAKALALALPQPPSGSFTRTAKSPASGKSYQFRCTAKEMVVCKTDRGSSVYVLI